MQLHIPRPIRLSGWAFRLSALRRAAELSFLAVILSLTLTQPLSGAAQHDVAPPARHDQRQAGADQGHGSHGPQDYEGGWEGSREGMAYSEFNHHLAGVLVLLLGLAELSQSLRLTTSRWVRLLLPGALAITGTFLLIWSDHDAWPVGALSLSQTWFGGDQEILQHKLYGLLALTIATVEILRRLGRLDHGGWLVPLPAFAIIGGWMLFGHSHGAHPSAHKIALHHTVMGTLAITAGSSKLFSAWKNGSARPVHARWDLLWAGLILLIGLQLIFYAE